MELSSLKSAIKFKMMKDLSTLKYGYQSIVEGCFDATQHYERLQVPKEHLSQMRAECVAEVLSALQTI